MFEAVDEMKRKLDTKRPLPATTLKSLRDHLMLEWTFHSNAIEGNTLTLSETKVALEGITVGGKTIKEHLEVINHKKAILLVEEIVRNHEKLSEWQMKNIHRLILKGIDDEHAGVYRKENVIISGAKHIPPDALNVPIQMQELQKWYDTQKLHPIETASILHIEFVKIHPFVDGSGRTARLLVNLELMKNGYPPIIIEKEGRSQYYAVLDKAHITGDNDDFVKLIVNALVNTYQLYFKVL
ncbi:Fic family protein [Chengkuizengella sediminis]|uniref:Fic family protein n=1 Tax=Chengkuizengella sediminis TaxID=1885917 RepID=UPI00138953A3|nr:Fic family protein [Chengkuizengella sediminis]NDI34587.1 Fic family protein [Chengkuizengella sediminis]